MSGNYPAGVTDNHPEFDQPDSDQFWEDAANKEARDDATNALQQAGMEPMNTAPRDREIIVVIGDTLKKQAAFWQDDMFSGGCWWDANGDIATDLILLRWNDEELLGWMEVTPCPTA